MLNARLLHPLVGRPRDSPERHALCVASFRRRRSAAASSLSIGPQMPSALTSAPTRSLVSFAEHASRVNSITSSPCLVRAPSDAMAGCPATGELVDPADHGRLLPRRTLAMRRVNARRNGAMPSSRSLGVDCQPPHGLGELSASTPLATSCPFATGLQPATTRPLAAAAVNGSGASADKSRPLPSSHSARSAQHWR